MDPTTAAALQKAYRLIQAGQKQEAQAILIPIVRADQDSVDAWYLLGFALSDPDKRLYAFQQVIRIDPSNQAAQKQIGKLLAAKSASPFTVMPDLSNMPPTPQETARPAAPRPAAAPPAGQQPKARKKRRFPTLLVVAGVLGLVACFAVVGLFVVFNNGGLAASGGLPFLPQPSATPLPSPTSAPPTPSPVPTSVYTPVFRSTACPFDVPLGTRVRCGVVRVPQNRQKNLTDLIELPVVVYQSPKPEADVVVYLQGGPGVESINWSLAFFQDYITPILQDHDMVFFDPRGTGRSKPALDCPELNPVFVDAYLQNRSTDEAFKDFSAAWSKCHERFTAEGIDPAAFNTTESAADVYDIVTALGYKQVSLLGISYGTRLGLTVMRDHPEIVRAAVLDSVVPMEGKMFNRRGTDVEYALNKVFTDCAASQRCNSAYPNLATVFNSLIDRFDKEPVTIKAQDPKTGFVVQVKANGVDMLGAVVAGLHNSDLVPVVPKAIYDIQNGDYTFLSFALGVPGGEYNTIGMGTYFATVCPEQVYASTPQEMDADVSLSPLIKKFAYSGLFGSSQNVFALCLAWGARLHDPRDSAPVKANVPTLIISGQYDPTTPVTAGQLVADDLPNNHFYVIPGMGHGATIGNDCSLGIMLAFLDDPGSAPDSSCLQAQNFDFFIPYDGAKPIELKTVSDAALHMQIAVPARWKKDLLHPTYTRHAYLFDPTMLDFESLPGPKSLVLTTLKDSFESSGLDEVPAKIGSHSANGLDWSIYQTKYDGEPVILALGQVSSRQTLALIMVVSAPERDAFYNGLFIPALDAFAP